jgi:hypothetical protein
VQKPVPTGLARFFPVWARFGSVFPVWLGFFRFFPVLVLFGFFGFLFIKLNRTEPASFFKILIGFFSVQFFQLFFSGFFGLISFLIFLLIPSLHMAPKMRWFCNLKTQADVQVFRLHDPSLATN